MEQGQDIKRPTGRRLKCQDPQIVRKYNKYLAKTIDTHQSLSQLKEIYKEGVTHYSNNSKPWKTLTG